MYFLKNILENILVRNRIVLKDNYISYNFRRFEELDLLSTALLAQGVLSDPERMSVSLHSLRSVLERSVTSKCKLHLWWYLCVSKKKLCLLSLIYISLILYFNETNDVRFLGLLIKLNELFLIPYLFMVVLRYSGLANFEVRTFIMVYSQANENSCNFTK